MEAAAPVQVPEGRGGCTHLLQAKRQRCGNAWWAFGSCEEDPATGRTHDWACLAKGPAETPGSWRCEQGINMATHPDPIPTSSMCCLHPVEPTVRTPSLHHPHLWVSVGHLLGHPLACLLQSARPLVEKENSEVQNPSELAKKGPQALQRAVLPFVGDWTFQP